jgi:hypothetical protein
MPGMSEQTEKPDPAAAPAAPADETPAEPTPQGETPEPPEGPANEPPKQKPGEIGGPEGPEPTRYGDWEVGGRCSDF